MATLSHDGMVNPASAPCEINRMFPGFEKLIESRIKKAQQEGAFENLPGTGQPLPLEDDRHIPEDLRMAYKVLKNADCLPPEVQLRKEIRITEDLRMAYKVLKNADCLPPEVQLRKEIRTTEDLLAGMTDTVQKYRTLKRLNFLILKLNALRDGNAAFDIPQRYFGEVVERLGADKV